MAKFRKKPIVIDAYHWVEAEPGAPDWLQDALRQGVVFLNPVPTGFPSANINALEGVERVNVGDWIIRGVKGELYPIRDDIFRATYDPA